MIDPDPRTPPIGATPQDIARVDAINARRLAAIADKGTGYPLTGEESLKVDAGLAWDEPWPEPGPKVESDDDPALSPEANIARRALKLMEATADASS